MREIYVTRERIREGYRRAGRLSKVDGELARAIVQIGDRERDRVPVGRVELSALGLKPSQTTMKPQTSIAIALRMLIEGEIKSDLGAIISRDGYIMDGHHRWAAMILLEGEGAKVGGVQVGLKGARLVKVLNFVTVGKYGRERGNEGSGDIADFNSERVRELLEGMVIRGFADEFVSWSGELVREVLEREYGSVERGIEEMSENAVLITKSVPRWAVDRVDMPVVNRHEVDETAGMLARGEIEVHPPYYEGVVRVASRYLRRRASCTSCRSWGWR